MVGIEVKRVLCMNEGTNETSYSQTSNIQKQVLSLTKPMKETAIREVYTMKLPTTLYIADLGCSSAEQNTLNLIFELINTIEKAAKVHQEYQVYLNDLPGNDFNTIFRSLSRFEEKLKCKLGDGFGHCFVNGVPGSFYGRLFPSNHLHFVHSSYSLHWLSQVPEGLEENKRSIYIAKTSPPKVLKAYSDQYEKDFSMFLRCRSQELVAGGMMVLTVLGRKSNELYSKEACYMWELLGMALNDMVAEDEATKNWWLIFNQEYVGYWPMEIFSTLAKGAARAGWGGEIYSPPNVATPGMGSGHFPLEGLGKACLIYKLKLVGSQGFPSEDDLIHYLTKPDCYKLIYGEQSQDQFGNYIYFGGPPNCNNS